METFSALLALWAGNSPVSGEFPAQRPVTRSCDVFFDLRLNKQLSKQSWGWSFEAPWRPLWCHCNVRVWTFNDTRQKTMGCNYVLSTLRKTLVVNRRPVSCVKHYDDVTMIMLASQITSLTVVYSIVYSGVNQRKHQSSASLAFVWEIHRGPVNFPHKGPVTRKMFPFDDVIMGNRFNNELEILS